MHLRPFQRQAAIDAVDFINTGEKGAARLYVGPTGCGKSYFQAQVLQEVDHAHFVAPTLDICAGVLKKLCPDRHTEEMSEERLRITCESHHLFTTVRYRNLLSYGRVVLPHALVIDEGHHATSTTNRELVAMAGDPVRIGATATPYRGSPRETAELLEFWNNDIYTMISLKGAVDTGVISAPRFSVWPLMNDDTIDVVNGEFVVSQVQGMVSSVMGDLVNRIAAWFNHETRLWDRPTTLVAPSVASVRAFIHELRSLSLPCIGVTGEGVDHVDSINRQAAFAKVVDRTHLLVQVRVVGEGVDLPLRRMVDCDPTMSPLKWMQRVGRITRPVGLCDCSAGTLCTRHMAPDYITTCHNLTRHSYLWQGIIPASEIRQAQQAWGPTYKPKRRSLARAIGLEGLGRFAVRQIPLADGLVGLFYGLQSGDDKYAVFVHPCEAEPFFFHRVDGWKADTQTITNRAGNTVEVRRRDYGKWSRIPSLPDLKECSSLPPESLSPKQQWKWKTSACRYGLDHTVEPTAATYQMLPILMDCRFALKPQE